MGPDRVDYTSTVILTHLNGSKEVTKFVALPTLLWQLNRFKFSCEAATWGHAIADRSGPHAFAQSVMGLN